MKTGRSLVELAREIERQNGNKQDFIVSTEKLRFELPSVATALNENVAQAPATAVVGYDAVSRYADQKARPVMAFDSPGGEHTTYGVTDLMHRQVAAHLKDLSKMPKEYYDYLLTRNPDLLGVTVNTLFRRNPTGRMVRTLDGNVRAACLKAGLSPPIPKRPTAC